MPGEHPGLRVVPQQPERHRRRGRGQEAGAPPDAPAERRSLRQQQRPGRRGDGRRAGVSRERGERPETGRGGQTPAAAALQVPVGRDQGQDDEQDAQRIGEPPGGQVGERQRERQRRRRPEPEETGFEAGVEVAADHEDGEPQRNGAERPGDRFRVESEQAERRERERIERRPQGGGRPVHIREPFPGQQVPGDGEVVDPVVRERRAVRRLAGEREPGRQRGQRGDDRGGTAGAPTGAPARPTGRFLAGGLRGLPVAPRPRVRPRGAPGAARPPGPLPLRRRRAAGPDPEVRPAHGSPPAPGAGGANSARQTAS